MLRYLNLLEKGAYMKGNAGKGKMPKGGKSVAGMGKKGSVPKGMKEGCPGK